MKKVEPLRKGSLRSRLLRLFEKEIGFELPFTSREETQDDIHLGIPTYSNQYLNRNEIKNALLEEEYKKAQGLRTWERLRCALA
ncbi:MAG: hypothetical protein OEY22_05995 [Candidatus Bathyarchaeota archaeon]|nr:hypothetical protein [Candidatus Bathyarchaeota archaeon]MDH5788391.1 hypothetical protein [Candidatus Bathyarchaeota archaeon]